jgi:hypothetical protein
VYFSKGRLLGSAAPGTADALATKAWSERRLEMGNRAWKYWVMERSAFGIMAVLGFALMLAAWGTAAGPEDVPKGAVDFVERKDGGEEMARKTATVGVYYFDGWAGRNRRADDPNEPWATNAPTHLTRRMVEEFPGREPIWGWRDDTMQIMERQIDVAADNGISFFAFCWYWRDSGGPINTEAIKNDPLHTSMELFMRARNNDRMKFCLMLANHQGSEIKGTEAWKQAADFWIPYFKHPRYMTVGGKPLIIVFDADGGDKDGFAYLQDAAHKAGLPGVAIASCWSGPPEMGYTLKTHYNIIRGYTAGSEAHPYSELLKDHEDRWEGAAAQPYMPIVIAGWDKRPWERAQSSNQRNSWYYPDATPEQFAAHLRDAIAWMDAHPDSTPAERIVMVYAWNEYGEGGYLPPTKGDPNGRYLAALRSVVMPAAAGSPGH